MEARKSRWGGVVMGPVVVVIALLCLWKNETRFDYHKAAADTRDVTTNPDSASPGDLISFTGPMDRSLMLSGEYVELFTGYLMVEREAEIYAWDQDRRDDRTVWELRWMSSLENNSRNSGITRELSSNRFLPESYLVGELRIDATHMQFVNDDETLDLSTLSVIRRDLEPEGQYLYLRKHQPDNLGDERIRYVGIPVPETATWFGRLDDDRWGVADTTNQRTDFVSRMIRDTGILHFIVAGDRATALDTMRAHLQMVKWIVRGIGTFCVVFGFFIFFSVFVGLLYHLPIIGSIASWGTLLVAAILGVPLALAVIAISYLVAHPLILFGLAVPLVWVGFLLRHRARRSRAAVKREVDRTYGRDLATADMKELEFVELARLAYADQDMAADEQQYLRAWAKKHRWNQAKYEAMLDRAKRSETEGTPQVSREDHLMNLVRLALADGVVTKFEIRSILQAAKRLGYDDAAVRGLFERVRRSASAGSI